MAVNPMQRKARNSFLMGMLVMLVIAALIIGVLVLQIINLKKEEQVREQASKYAYVLTKSVKSGETITESSYTKKQVATENAPTDTNITFSENTIAKINLTAGTILSSSMVSDSGRKLTADLRLQEYNMLILPVHIYEGDFVDVRLTLPSGQDYIVLSKKEVKAVDEHTVWLELSEDEILTMSNAIVETYTMTGSNIYANLYVEPGLQKDATPTYPVSKNVLALMEGNPNIVSEAMTALKNRYTSTLVNQRNNDIQSALDQYIDNGAQNVEVKVREQNEKTKELREKYLETLSQ